jgi:nucleotide-binding universal stress UspA family protein
MFENALVGVDGRQGGRDAIALASQLTERGGRITLAHAHSGRLRPSRAVTPGMVGQERQSAGEMLEQERAATGISADLLEIESAHPGRALHQRAEEQQADLIVVGSCSRSALGRAMLGDDTRAALNGAPCAVAIASLGFATHPTIARIGVGYDESPESKAALAAARDLGAATGAQLSALEVITIPSYAYAGYVSPAAMEDIDAGVAQANERLSAQLPDLQVQATCGLTGEELAAFGDQLDLLVLGSRGFGPIKRLIVGSTAEHLQRHARCCLLVLPRTAFEDQMAAAGGA